MLRNIWVAVASLLLFFTFAGSADAQSVLDFPRVISSSDVFTGIAVGNATSQSASVTFTAYLPDGSLLSGTGITNPATVTLVAGAQHARLFGEIFGNGVTFDGWVQVTSSVSGLTGFTLNGRTSGADFDGAVAVKPLTQSILPFISEIGGKTEFTIVNPNEESASAVLTLFGLDGKALGSKQVGLAAHGMVRQAVHDLFSGDLSAAGQLRVQSTLPLSAYELVSEFQISQGAIPRETVAWVAQQITASKSAILPQFVTGGDWLSYLGLVNAAGYEQAITVTAYKEDGTLWELAENPKTVVLGGHASTRTTVGDFFGFPAETFNTGWIEIRSKFGFMVGYVGYGNRQTPSFALVAGSNAETASSTHVYSHIAEGAGYFTGLTLVNPNKGPADIDLFILRADGTTIGEATFSVPAGARVGKLFRELLPASLTQLGGWVLLRSSAPIPGAVLFGSADGSALASVPQQNGNGTFLPPEQRVAAITGTVRFGDGAPVADAEVALAGPVTTTARTDAAGRYVFSQLPAGNYSVSISRTAWDVAPSSRSVTVGRANIDDVDFQAVSLPTRPIPSIELLAPSLMTAGGGSFQLAVVGQNFTFDSQIFLNGVPFRTTFVDSTRLTALVPGSVIAQAGVLSISVTVPGPGGGRSNEVPLTVNGLPQITFNSGVVPVGSFPSGVAIHKQKQVALVANEAGDSVSVVDLKTLRSIAEVRVGRSPSEGIAIDYTRNIALVSLTGGDELAVIDLNTYQVLQNVRVGQNPMGIAINATTNRAVVVNGGADSVSIVDLSTLRVVGGPVRVGSAPADVAVNATTNQAVVTNRNSNTVSVIDLSNLQVLATIPVGDFPRGVAIDDALNLAVVANGNSNDVAVIDLTRRAVRSRIPIGAGPQSVAINSAARTALVTNSGFVRGVFTPGAAISTTVAVINLDWDQAENSIVVGTAPFGVVFDADTIVVANYGSNNISVIRPFPNSIPHIVNLQPKTIPAGSQSTTITINGTGFTPQAIVRLNGSPLATLYVSQNILQAVVPGDLIEQVLTIQSGSTSSTDKGSVRAAVTQAQFNITITNPPPGGGTSPADPLVAQLTIANPAPVLLSISPVDAEVNSGNVLLTLNGNNFNATSIVNFGSLQLSPISVNGVSMTVAVPKSEISATGTFSVSVSNPAPGGGATESRPFTVFEKLVEPVVGSIGPASVPAGASSTTFTISGRGFVPGTSVSVDGVTIPAKVGSDSISFELPDSLLGVGRTLNGIVVNSRPATSTGFFINVLNPEPKASTFGPQSGPVGFTGTLEIAVAGSQFVSDSSVTIEETPIPSRFISPTEVRGFVDEAFLGKLGQFRIGVLNPGPGGGYSDAGTFTITENGGGSGSGGSGSGGGGGTNPPTSNPGPELSDIDPDSGIVGTRVPVTISGKNFVADQTEVITCCAPEDIQVLVGQGLKTSDARQSSLTQADSSTSLSRTFAIHNDAAIGGHTISVSTPNGTTGGIRFSVLPVDYSPMRITPRSGQVGTSVTVTITGSNFVPGTTVTAPSDSGITVGTVNVTSATSLTTTLSLAIDATPDVYSLEIFAAPSTKGRVNFTVLPGNAPTLTALSPDGEFPATVVLLTLKGTNFVKGATWPKMDGNGVRFTNVEVIDSTTLVATLSIDVSAITGYRNVSVTTPVGSSGTKNFMIFAGGGGGGGGGGSTPPTGTTSPDATNTRLTPCGPAPAALCQTTVLGDPVHLAAVVTDLTNPALKPTGKVTFTLYNTTNTANGVLGSATVDVINGVAIWPTPDITTLPLGTRLVTATFAPDAAFSGTRSYSSIISPSTNTDLSDGARAAFIHDVIELIPAQPTARTLRPNLGVPGQTVDVILTGTGFIPGHTTVEFVPPAPEIQITATPSRGGDTDTTLYRTLIISGGATLGGRNVTVTTPYGTTGGLTFTVVSSASVVEPATGVAGQVVPVTITAANFSFVAGTTVTPPLGSGITVGTVALVDAHTVSTTFTISGGAPFGTKTISITSGAINSTALFTVVPASGPTLININPSSGPAGTTLTMTLTGTNFVPGATSVSMTGDNVKIGQVTVSNDYSSLTAELTIGAGASLTDRQVTVTTPVNTSNALVFTINLYPTSTNPDSTKTTLTPCGPSPAPLCQTTNFGDPVHLAAVVTDTKNASLKPTGTVTFTVYSGTSETSTVLATATVSVSQGVAIWPTPDITTLPLGTRIVTASFAPAPEFAGTKAYASIISPSTNTDLSNASRAAFIHDVVAAATKTTLTPCGPNPPLCQTTKFGDPVHLAASVTNLTNASVPTGKVTFTLYNTTNTADGVFATAIVDVVNGVAIWPTPDITTLPLGTRLVTATFAPDAAFGGAKSYASIVSPSTGTDLSNSSRAAFIHDVVPADTTTSVTSSLNPSTNGQAVTFTATVARAVASADAAAPTGTVTFKDGAATLGTGTISSGQATFSTTSLAAGSHNITAVYGGDANYNTSTSAPITQTVNDTGNKTDTTTTIASSLNPSVGGQSVTFTATVAGSGGTPTGSVTFKDGPTTLGTGTLSGGQATFSTYSLSVAAHSITAVYGGDSAFNGSTSTPLTQNVTLTGTQINSSTTLASSLNPSVAGQTVTFTATVTGSGAPTGSVTFKDGATDLATATLTNGQATYSTSSLSVALHSITAVYSGDNAFTTSTSAALNQNVTSSGPKIDSATALASSLNPSVAGQSVTFTATVTGNGTPTGTVTFKDGITPIGTGTIANGQATFSTSSLSIGSHTITAEYIGDNAFNGSTSSPLTQTVNDPSGKLNATTTVTSSRNPAVADQNVTFTATVTGSNGTPTGTVTFKDGGTTLATVPLSSGQASFTTNDLVLGIHPIVAEYSGDSTYNGSTSTTVSEVVTSTGTKLDTTVILISSLDPAVVGQRVIFDATVIGDGKVNGTVTFKDGAITLGTTTLVGGHTTFNTAKLSPGEHPITATYNGSGAFNSSTSTIVEETIVTNGPKFSTTTIVVSSLNPSLFGDSVTFTATVTGNGEPSGSVTFKDGGPTLGTATLTDGVATFTTTTLSVGSHAITAVYSGDDGFITSTSAPLTQTVTSGSIDHITISPASASIVAGGSQTYTVTAFGAGDNSLGDVTASATFGITPDGSCTLNSCTASIAGTHIVTGSYAGKTASASLTVTINPALVHHITISPASASIIGGGSQSYTAAAFDAGNNLLGDVTAGTTFAITPDGSCTTNSCTATVAGPHTVTGTFAGKTANASLTVTINTTSVHHITISPASASIIGGGSQSYTAAAFDAGNNLLGDVTAGTTFAITPDGSCTTNSCTATVAGPHTVTGNYSGKTATASLTVTINTSSVHHITISPASATIVAGGTQSYTAAAFDASNNLLGDVTASTAFAITPDGSCAANTCGAIVAVSHTVTGTFAGKTATASLAVVAGPLDHITVVPASSSIGTGGIQVFTTFAFDLYNNPLGDVTSLTTYTISPEGSCTNNSCTASVGGLHTVTGTYNGKTATSLLNVIVVPPDACVATPDLLSPPNHKLAAIHVSVNPGAVIPGANGFKLDSVTSNEGQNLLGDGTTSPDIQEWAIGTSDVDGLLRSERSGTLVGRIYSINYVLLNGSTAVGACSATVKVDH